MAEPKDILGEEEPLEPKNVIRQGAVCDGYDVTARLADGRRQTWHFAKKPDDLAGTLASLEAGLLAREAAEIVAQADKETVAADEKFSESVAYIAEYVTLADGAKLTDAKAEVDALAKAVLVDTKIVEGVI